jgi:hypothetical protein
MPMSSVFILLASLPEISFIECSILICQGRRLPCTIPDKRYGRIPRYCINQEPGTVSRLSTWALFGHEIKTLRLSRLVYAPLSGPISAIPLIHEHKRLLAFPLYITIDAPQVR